MTKEDAAAVLDSIGVNEAIPAALAVEMLRAWKAQAIDTQVVIETLRRLRPAEVMDLHAFAERKLARRNRPR